MRQTEFFSFWTIFCSFSSPPLTSQRIKILKKWKKPYRYHHFTQVHHKWQSYDIWFLRYQLQQRDFFLSSWVIFVIWHVTDVTVIFHFGHFFALSPPNSPKNENFKKIKKTSGDIIILHKCTRTHDRMLLFLRYGAWRMFFILGYFSLSPFPLTARKIKISKIWKKNT